MSVFPVRWANLALGLACLVVIAAPLAVGAVHAPVLVPLALLSIAAFGILVLDRIKQRRSIALPTGVLPGLLGLTFTTFQLLPLPSSWRRWLSSEGFEQTRFITSSLQVSLQDEVKPVLSLDPPETAMALLRLVVLICISWVVANRAKHEVQRKWTYRALLVGTCVLLLVALGHRLARVEQIWGIFHASHTPLYAPLVNPNHLAKAFGVFSLLCLGRALVLRDRLEAAWFTVGGLLSGTAVLLTLSRSAILIYLGMLSIAALWLWRNSAHLAPNAPQKKTSNWVRLLTFQLTIFVIGGLGLFVASDALTAELLTLGNESFADSKLVLYPLALRLVLRHWSVGVGNNAFVSTFPSIAEIGELTKFGTYSHPENIILQVLCDYGLIMGGLLLLWVTWLLCSSTRHIRKTSLGAAAAIGYLLLGDLFDFALETGFGVALLAVSLGLFLVDAPLKMTPGWRLPNRAAGLGVTLMILLTALASSWALQGNRRTWDSKINAATLDSRRAILERALALHPSDAHYSYLLATEARRRGQPEQIMVWANRTLNLWPAHRGAHIEAARALVALGRVDQAMLEYQLAYQCSTKGRRELMREVAARTQIRSQRELALPDNDAQALTLLCQVWAEEKRFEEAQDCYDRAFQLSKGSTQLAKEAIEIAILRGDGPGALRRLRDLGILPAPDGELAVIAAKTIAATEGAEAALAQSERWLVLAKQKQPLQKWRLQFALTTRQTKDVPQMLHALRNARLTSPELDWLDRMEATYHMQQNAFAQALRMWKHITLRRPKDISARIAVVSLEMQLGMLPQAEQSLGRLERLSPEHDDAKSLRTRLEDKKRVRNEERWLDLTVIPESQKRD